MAISRPKLILALMLISLIYINAEEDKSYEDVKSDESLTDYDVSLLDQNGSNNDKNGSNNDKNGSNFDENGSNEANNGTEYATTERELQLEVNRSKGFDDYSDSTIANNEVTVTDNVMTTRQNYGRDNDSKPETTTTKTMDAETVGVRTPEPSELELTGQRNPKIDSSDTVKDKATQDTKEIPAATRSSTLKGWLEDAWTRPPAGILVPLRPMALTKALAVWNDLVAEGLHLSDIVLICYDSTGVSWRSKHNLQPHRTSAGEKSVSEALSKLLLKHQGVHTDSTSDGTMKALASAAKLVPYDSALFVVTDKGAGDPQRLPLALRALVEKRLKVYTIWTDPSHPSEESEAALQELRNISKNTEGAVLPYSVQVMEDDDYSNLASEAELQLWDPDGRPARQGRLDSRFEPEQYDNLLVRRGGGEALSLGVPVETGVRALRVLIEGAVEHAVLYPPNEGPQIDLYNESSVAAFSPASRTEGIMPRDVYLVFPGSKLDMDLLSVLPAVSSSSPDETALAGVWHLSVKCDTCDYRLHVSAATLIHFDVDVSRPGHATLKVSGPVASIRETLLVDEYGKELAKLPFNHTLKEGRPREPLVELVADVPLPTDKRSRMYIKILGRDTLGDPFVRLSGPLSQPEIRLGRAAVVFPDSANDLERAEEFNSRIYQSNGTGVAYGRAVSQLVNQRGTFLTTVQIGLSTRLYGSPGDNIQLHFEVTNYREQAETFQFGAVGELRFLTGINPRSQRVASGQTANVVVSATVPTNAQTGLRDTVTFTAYGLDQVSITAHIYVVSGQETADVWAPEVRHNFQGSCWGRMGADCAQHVWSATVVARDPLGGLLRLSSSPMGVLYDNTFVSGSREEVVAAYRATCCAPRVLINAVDIYGNTNSYVVDISNFITPAGIAAIALGALLAISLILLVAFLIYWCVRRRQESREIPSYNTRNMS